MRPFRLALQFLTILPVPAPLPDADTARRSLLYYPLVGLVLGSLLALAAWLLSGSEPLLAAVLLLLLWVLLTGALHLDGLADSFDALLGAHGEPQRALAIMKDPQSGPAGVAAVVLLLLLKAAALAALFREGMDYGLLLLIPALARASLLPWFAGLDYLRSHGLGAPFADYRFVPVPALQLVLWGLACLLLLGVQGLWLLAALAVLFLLWRHLCLGRFGGTTGDTAGAMVELAEGGLLVIAAL